MNHKCGLLPGTGDRGQRYEVTYFDPDENERKVFGWSDSPEGARTMGDSIDLNPSWEFPQVRDRSYYLNLYGDESEPHPHHCATHCWYADRPCIHCAAAEKGPATND